MTRDPLLPAPVDLLGVPIHPVSPDELVAAIVRWGAGAELRRVYNVNIHAMNLAAADAAFRRELGDADLVFCDGFGVKWGARLAGVAIPHRMTPPDWIDDFAAATAAAGQPVFALGDEPGVAARCQARLAREHPGYLDAGSHDGFSVDDAVIARINASGARHLLVGMGMPRQERWIAAHRDRLAVATAITVGALFRWHAGVEPRAPRWLTEHGLEWLARLARHPVRLFGRYAIGNPRFLVRVMRARGRRSPG